jgi:HD-GYP domain-containing protein (c-di-GMP phosphodiesterase class II)
MRLHPAPGAGVIARFASFEDGIGPVRHHHERWDGLGYPDGMARTTNPVGTRVLVVADAFDALITSRGHRGATSRELAVAILREGACTLRDSIGVKALLAHLGEATVGVPTRWDIAPAAAA